MTAQTHTTNVRLQAGVLPYRLTRRDIQVLLVTSRSCEDRWLVPKGNIEVAQTPVRCAAREAWEEAGVVGVIGEHSIGTYEYTKRGVKRRVRLYPMRVREQANHWPEIHERRRLWVPIEDVSEYIVARDLLRAFDRLHAVLRPQVVAA